MTSNRSRQLFDVPLKVFAGSRFQPTGFPDLGPATFDRPRSDDSTSDPWVKALLVESAQSMANRAEAVGWDPVEDQPVDVLAGLPWVRVLDPDGSYLTSSRTEAHRLASAFVKESTLDGRNMDAVIRERLNLRDDRPVSPKAIAHAVFGLDPLSLVHGVFFADKRWPGQPKIARVLTGFIEAFDVKEADSGGVKKDDVVHALADGAGTAEGYGTVPYHRREWTASQINAYFTIDRAQIRSYALGDAATGLLEAIARWEIRCLIDEPMRLRTACDLEAIAPGEVHDQTGEPLSERDELEDAIHQGIEACAELADPGKALDVVWKGRARKGASG